MPEIILEPLYIASGFIVFDIVSGIIKALYTQHSLKSSIMMSGMAKKLAMWYVIAFSMFMQISAGAWDMLPEELGIIYPATCLAICMYEGNSICENIVEIFPELTDMLPFLKIFVHKEDK